MVIIGVMIVISTVVMMIIIASALTPVDPEVVVAGREEDAAELRAQLAKAESQLREVLGDVAGDDEHVLLELRPADLPDPVLGPGVVEVDVRDGEDPRRGPGPARVPPEPL